MSVLDALDERFRYEDRLKAAGVEVLGGGIDQHGDWEIVVVDPHQRRGPRVSLFGSVEANRFLERIGAG